MIDGFKRIVNEYLNNPVKMMDCFPDEELRLKVEQIYVFPNIELRLDNFVGEGANSVNYHVIFSGSVLIQDIEDNFLHQLKFQPQAGAKLPLIKSNIESSGKTIKQNNGEGGSDLLVGLQHVTVNYSDILEVLKSNPSFNGSYIITIPVDEDLSSIQWNGRDYSTRKNLYQQCHCYMTSNVKTAAWALADGQEEERKNEFGSLKPCIWGSDAHEYERMFQPANDKFCWIKAEQSFEGLLQILYEPRERVTIQKGYPDEKDVHQIIQSIQFEDDNFQIEPIVFNDYLTCIIGGKSTGKSLLLRQLAKAIDPSYTDSQEKVTVSRKPFPVKKATVTWKDGTTDSKKIVYIPQTFLNRTIDNPEESTAINKIIEDVLQQEPEISAAFATLKDTAGRIKKRVQADISEYCEQVKKLRELEETIKREGSPDSFSKTLEQLEAERTELAEKINVKPDEIDRYAELEKLIQSLTEKQEEYSTELCKYEALAAPVVVVPGYFTASDGITILHVFQEDFPNTNAELLDTVNRISESVQPEWKQAYECLVQKLQTLVSEIKKRIADAKTEYDNLKIKVEQGEQLQKIAVHISAENLKLQAAKDRQESKIKLEGKIDELETRITQSQQDYYNAYKEYCNVVITTGTKKNTLLTFDAQATWKQKDFLEAMGNIFDNRNYSSFKIQYKYDLAELQPENYGSGFLIALWKAITFSQEIGGLTIKTAYTNESALQLIFGDWYNIHYIVKSGDDTIEEMSPGKKALVLLELLISLEDSKCPILIDQPEDDLDNRSIYDDLVQYIKKKKKERQIIVVTHNANVVLGADAEEVIIANQNGKGTENASKRFEYRSGAIENDEIGTDNQKVMLSGILNRNGIQTQICDILEGGRSAFELRQNKYMVIPHH
jgi:ABC-type cobalamin/Fe3+-siderophores transport system ATPase subunit/predicted  nucleic acid-binding Zn-ribbon protein